MLGFRPFLAAALIATGLGQGPANAAPVGPSDRNAEGSVNIVRPFSLRKLADLDFATLATDLGGTATINATSGAMTTSAALFHVGGTPTRAKWRVTTLIPTIVRITVPSTPTVLTRVGGSETLTLSNFTQDGLPLRLILLPGTLDFHVGARLAVNANPVEGLYVGTFDIEVDHL